MPDRSHPSLQGLLEHRPWVRAVARRLVRDESAADDLAQEAWLRALRSPPDPARDPRPWLRRVLANLASNRRRGEGRRRLRETTWRDRRTQRTPEELVAEAEQHKRLVGLVLDLEEPFKTALVMRYYEGLAPGEIAERLGIPMGTVHSRVARAVERLKARLDGEEQGDRRRWIAALLPLAGLERALPVGTATTTSILGVLLMTITKPKVALLLLLFLGVLAGGAFWLAADSAGEGGGHAALLVAPAEGGPQLETRGAALARAEAARTAAPPATAAAATVRGRILRADGTPAAGAELVVLPASSPGIDDEPGRDARIRLVTADEEGRFEASLPPMTSPRLVVHAADHMPAAVALAGRTPGEPLEVRLEPALPLVVRVEGPDGRWPAGCALSVGDRAPDSFELAADPARQAFWYEIAAAEADGPAEHVVPVTTRAPLIVTISPARGFAAVPPVRRLDPSATEATFHVVPSGRITLSLKDAASGTSLGEDAWVSVHVAERTTGATAWSVGSNASAYAFDSRLAPGSYDVVVEARGYRRWAQGVEILAGGETVRIEAPLARRSSDVAYGRLLLRPVASGDAAARVLALARANRVGEAAADLLQYTVLLRRTDDAESWREMWHAPWGLTDLHETEDGRFEVILALYPLQMGNVPAGTYDVYVAERGTGRAGLLRGARVFGDQVNELEVQLRPGTFFRLTDLMDRDVELLSLEVRAGEIENLPVIEWARDGCSFYTKPTDLAWVLETPRRSLVLGPFPAGEVEVVATEAKGGARRFRVRGASASR